MQATVPEDTLLLSGPTRQQIFDARDRFSRVADQANFRARVIRDQVSAGRSAAGSSAAIPSGSASTGDIQQDVISGFDKKLADCLPVTLEPGN